MSHFCVWVVIPNRVLESANETMTSTEATEDYLEKVLEPYNENKEMAPHETECRCNWFDNSSNAKKAAEEKMGKTEEEIRNLAEGNRKRAGNDIDDDSAWGNRQKLWDEIAGPFYTLVREFEKSLPPASFKSDCEDCHGTGIRISTGNKDARWDWWEIGGRWSDYISQGDIFDVTKLTLPLADDMFPFAIVDRSGQWHQMAEMHWFAITSEEKDTDVWKEEVAEIIKDSSNTTIVVVDCHI